MNPLVPLPASIWAMGRSLQRHGRAVAAAVPALLVAAGGPAQPVTISVGANVRVTPVSGATTPHVEPHLAVDPRDGRRLIATAMAALPDRAGPEVRVFTSADSGQSWVQRPLGDSSAAARGADPYVAFGPDGVAHLVKLPGELWRSTDGGRTWAGPVPLPRGGAGVFDYPKLAVDRTAGPRAGRLYVWAWQDVRLAPDGRAAAPTLLWVDRGERAVSGPTRVLQNDIVNQVGEIGVLSDGTVVGTFHEIEVRGELLSAPRLWVAWSADGGASLAPSTLVAEHFRADSPALAVDGSAGPSRDRVYLASAGVRADGSRAVFVLASADRGRTWSAPVLVRDTLGSRAGYPPHHPMIAVNKDGVVGVTWQDPRYELGPRCFQLSFAASLDGGRTFLPARPVATAPSCADVPGNQVPLEDGRPVARRFGDGGDYHGLVALPDGSFQALWADSRTGTYQLWTARIRLTTGQ